jgi:hypothetical protein
MYDLFTEDGDNATMGFIVTTAIPLGHRIAGIVPAIL